MTLRDFYTAEEIETFERDYSKKMYGLDISPSAYNKFITMPIFEPGKGGVNEVYSIHRRNLNIHQTANGGFIFGAEPISIPGIEGIPDGLVSRVECIDYSKIEAAMKEIADMKSRLLLSVAEQVLGRRPDDRDIGTFTLVSGPGFDYEVLCYLSNRLGIVRMIDPGHDNNNPNIYSPISQGWEFVPDKK